MFSWGDRARVRRILDGTGFREVALTPLDLGFTLGAAPTEAADLAMFIGQGARLLLGFPETSREAQPFEAFFKAHEGPTGVSLAGGLWLVSALN